MDKGKISQKKAAVVFNQPRVVLKALSSEEDIVKLAKNLEAARLEGKAEKELKDKDKKPNNRKNSPTGNKKSRSPAKRQQPRRRPKGPRQITDNKWKQDFERIKEADNVTLEEFNSVVAMCARNREWDAVLQVLEMMHHRNLPPDLSTYKAIVIAFSQSGEGRQKSNNSSSSDMILQVINVMPQAGIEPDADIYSIAISSLTKEGKLSQASNMLNKAIQADVKASNSWFEDLIAAQVRARKVDAALTLLRRMKANNLTPTVHAYNNILNGLKNGRNPQLVMRLLNEIICPAPNAQHQLPSPNQRTFINGILALGRAGKWEQALEILHQMERSKIKNHLIAYNAALSACERAQQWRAAKALLDEMVAKKDGVRPDKISYNTVISACAKAGKSRTAIQLLDKMISSGLEPDRISYNSAISACAQAGKWSDAHVLMEKARLDGIEPDVITYTSLINACSRSGDPKRAISFLEMMKTCGIKPDVVAYTAAIDACSKGNLWKEALDLVDEMRDAGVEPNERTYRATITACGKGGRWERALDILDHMRARGFTKNAIYAYNAAAAACEHAGQYDRVMGLLNSMAERGVQPDAFTYSTAISACGKAGEWEKAVELMSTMRAGGPRMQPNLVTYTAAIHACVQGNQWEEAQKLWSILQVEGLQPDLICYNTLLSGARRSNDWKWGLKIMADMLASNVKPDMITISNLMEVLEKNSQDKEADALFEEALKQGLIFGPSSLDMTWEVDVSRLPPLVAKHAVRHKLKKLKKSHQSHDDALMKDLEQINDLVFITGTGKTFFNPNSGKKSNIKSSGSYQVSSKSYIYDLLCHDFGLKPTVPKSLPGCLVISKKVLHEWLLI